MRTKLDDLRHATALCTYDIIILVKTWLTAEYGDAELGLGQYCVYRRDRDSDASGKLRGGGVLVAIHRNLNSTAINVSEHIVEHVFVSVTCGSQKIVIGAVYFPPQSSMQVYNEHGNAVIELIERFNNSEVLICGDYNLPDAVWLDGDDGLSVQCPASSSANIICACYGYLNMRQLNSIPNIHGRFLDLVFCNNQEVNVSVALECILNVSQHHIAYEISIPIYVGNNSLKCDILYYDFKNCNFQLINEFLAYVSWKSVFNETDINVCVENFYNILYDVIAIFVPVKRFKTTNFPTWFSADLQTLVMQKKIAHKKYKQNGLFTSYQEFSLLRDRCKRLQSACYKEYLSRVDNDLRVNPAFFWRHVNNSRRCTSYPHSMFLMDSLANDGNGIVDLFARHFSASYVRENCDFSACNIDNVLDVNVVRVSLAEVFEGINQLKMSYSHGPDGIPSAFLRQCVFSLSRPLHYIFCLSLDSCVFPQYWKTSFLTPIYKSGNREDITNYRGICIQSAIPKLFDKLVADQLSWICRNFVRYEQHGFSRGRSTVTNLLSYEQYLLGAFERGMQVDAVYTDFSKAFDRVNHELLVGKLRALGFGTSVTRWIKSFLTERSQCIRILNHISRNISVCSGVPQGSHCGPLLFNLFINDIGEMFNHSEYLLFADDLKLYRGIESVNDVTRLQEDLNRLYHWSERNGLSLNVKKCFCISFGRKRNIERHWYSLNGALLESVSEIRDLGVLLDSQLNFRGHINNILRLGLRNLGFVTRYSKQLSASTFRVLYFSMVRSGLEYASVVWSPSYQCHIAEIESVQRRFLRTLAFKAGINIYKDASFHIDYGVIMNAFGVATLEKRRDLADVLFLYKLLNGFISCPPLLESVQLNTIHRTRGSVLLSIPFHSANYGYYSPLTRMCRLFNTYSLDPFSCSVSEFKTLVSAIGI